MPCVYINADVCPPVGWKCEETNVRPTGTVEKKIPKSSYRPSPIRTVGQFERKKKTIA